MDLQSELVNAHKEHEEILGFLAAWENTLDQAASEDYEIRLRGLRQLQGMEGNIAAICDHCQEEETSGSPLFVFTADAERTRLKDEHFQLHRANYEFRQEMEFTTASHTEDLCSQGRSLLAALRQHIAYEEELLKRIEADQLRSSNVQQLTGVNR
jgi:hypothetical protein